MSIPTVLFIGEDPSSLALLRQEAVLHCFHVVHTLDDAQTSFLLKQVPFFAVFYSGPLSSFFSLTSEHQAKDINWILLTDSPLSDDMHKVFPSKMHHIKRPLSSLELSSYFCKQEPLPSLLIKNKYPLIAKDARMQELFRQVQLIAKSQAHVFIIGESGTGKEVIASAIHHFSTRAKNPFIKVNCAAIPDSLLESEFFGHEKGSFTGAVQRKPGRFELADQGTLLLDEVSEIPLSLQAKLLRAVQEKEFERVGGISPVQVDTRIVSTSNRNMKEMVEKKLFREDLYFRLHVIPLYVPPLRERKDDIIPIATLFLEQFCQKNHQEKKVLSEDAVEALLAYSWPGNVRELANVLERAVVLHSHSMLRAKDLFLPPPSINNIVQQESFVPTPLVQLEKEHILNTLRFLGNNKTQTAKALGITLKTLRNKLNAYHKESI